jgi:hypothetical protein
MLAWLAAILGLLAAAALAGAADRLDECSISFDVHAERRVASVNAVVKWILRANPNSG